MIVSVEKGDEILLARSPHFPEGIMSVLAGFVEPGESVEEAVIREVWEETRIVVEDVQYYSSQPWPYPNSATGRPSSPGQRLESGLRSR